MLQDIKIGRLFAEFIEILTHHRIHFPPDYMICQGVGRQLDPNLISPHAPRWLLVERFSPKIGSPWPTRHWQKICHMTSRNSSIAESQPVQDRPMNIRGLEKLIPTLTSPAGVLFPGHRLTDRWLFTRHADRQGTNGLRLSVAWFTGVFHRWTARPLAGGRHPAFRQVVISARPRALWLQKHTRCKKRLSCRAML